MNARHLSKSNEHFTPPDICDRVRDVFGGAIDLDPASCEQADRLVRARTFYTLREDGLTLPWWGRVFLNPPGGTRRPGPGRRPVSQAALWWATLAQRFEHGRIEQAAFVVFNLETLRHAVGWGGSHPLDFPIVLFADRIDYRRPGRHGPEPQGSPSHPSALVYLGPRVERFRAVFGPLGHVTGEKPCPT